MCVCVCLHAISLCVFVLVKCAGQKLLQSFIFKDFIIIIVIIIILLQYDN